MPILWWVTELYGHKSGTWPTYTLSSRIKLNQEKEKVNEEEYDSKDSQSSSECCTPHQTSKTQDKHPVCSPCTGGILKKTRVQKGKVRGFKKTTWGKNKSYGTPNWMLSTKVTKKKLISKHDN